MESAVREQQGVLTGSGILSVLGLLGRGTRASSSREIRKFPLACAPLPLPTWRRPEDGAATAPGRMRAPGGYLRGRRARWLTGRRRPPPPFPSRRGGGSSRRDFPSIQRWRPRRCCHLGAEPSAALESRCHRPEPALLGGFLAAPESPALPPALPWRLSGSPTLGPGVMSWATRPPFLPPRHAAGQCGPVGVRKEMHCGVASRWRRRRPWLDPAAAAAAGEQQTLEPEPGEAGRDGMGDSGRGECPVGPGRRPSRPLPALPPPCL